MTKKTNALVCTLLAITFAFLFGFSAFAETMDCEAPVLITSAGQSMEVKMVQMLCNKVGIENKYDNLAAVNMLKGMKTLIIVPGVSLKGMGTAGVDIGSENSRIAELGQRSKADNIKILVIHTGGHIRRDPINDPIIEKTLDVADYAIVCGDGNQDRFFNTKCDALGIPLMELDNVSKLPETLKSIFHID